VTSFLSARPGFRLLWAFCVCLWLCWGTSAHATPKRPELVIGVLSPVSAAHTERTYAQMVRHLGNDLPGWQVRLLPLPWGKLERAVRVGSMDFVLTNGVQHVALRHRNAVSDVLLTQQTQESGAMVSSRGAVVFRLASRTDLEDFDALHGRSLTVALPTPHTQGLLSYLGPMAELAQAGIDTDSWNWQASAGPQHQVIDAVLQGQADLGFVRTGLIEELERSGLLDATRLAVLNPQPAATYPVRLSTALYPEWALAPLPHVDSATVQAVRASLLSMGRLAQANPKSEPIGFVLPADHSLLVKHMRLVSMQPYDQAPDITWADVWRHFRWPLVYTVLGLVGALALLVHLLRAHRARMAVVNNLQDGFVRVDSRWRCRMVNRQALKWLGTPPGQKPGRDLWTLFPADMGHRFEHIYRSAMETVTPQTIEMCVGPLKHWLECRLQPDGKGMSIFLTDITARKQQEDQLRQSEARNKAIVSSLPDLLFWLDREGTVLDFQTGATPEDLFLPPETFLHQRVADILPPKVAIPAMAALTQTLAGLPGMRVEYALPLPRGQQHFEMRMVKIGPNEVLGIARNITDRRQAQETQRLAASVFDHSSEGIFITDADLRIVQVNPAFQLITGFAADDVLGQDLTRLGLNVNDDTYQELLRTVQGQRQWKGEVWGRRKNGEVFLELLSLTALVDAKGRTSHHVGVFSDVSVLKAREEEMRRVASHDALTGLPNRRLLAELMKTAVSRARRTEQLMTICYFDLDDFKHINDTHGHEAGDLVLTTVARRVQAELHTDDTLARLGGDEFVALVNGLENLAACEDLARRLLAAVQADIDLGHTLVNVSASIGIALYPQDNVSPDTLLRHADQAMWRAKEAGRNRFHVFAAEKDRDARSRRDLFHRLRQALNQQELRLYFQPKVNLRKGDILGYEALIRWQHPEQGLLPPAAFLIDLLDGDLEIDLGNWVIDEALRQWCEWQATGVASGTLSVNVSSHQLLKPGFVQALSAALARHPGFDPHTLQLEILESAAITEIDQAAHVMRQCQELGVGFALDDFGTGYSSLSHFRRLPVNTLKVDQSFVRGMLSSPDDRGIVAAVVQMARAFHRQVVAEGVETPAHGEALLELGCDLAQGYAIARPMPAGDVPAWSAGWRREHATATDAPLGVTA